MWVLGRPLIGDCKFWTSQSQNGVGGAALPAVGKGSQGKGKFGCFRSAGPENGSLEQEQWSHAPKSRPPPVSFYQVWFSSSFHHKKLAWLSKEHAMSLLSHSGSQTLLTMERSLIPAVRTHSTIDPLHNTPQQAEMVCLNHTAIMHVTKMLVSS